MNFNFVSEEKVFLILILWQTWVENTVIGKWLEDKLKTVYYQY